MEVLLSSMDKCGKNIERKTCFVQEKSRSFVAAFLNDGFVAEWLGTALQKLLQRFESARNL